MKNCRFSYKNIPYFILLYNDIHPIRQSSQIVQIRASFQRAQPKVATGSTFISQRSEWHNIIGARTSKLEPHNPLHEMNQGPHRRRIPWRDCLRHALISAFTIMQLQDSHLQCCHDRVGCTPRIFVLWGMSSALWSSPIMFHQALKLPTAQF